MRRETSHGRCTLTIKDLVDQNLLHVGDTVTYLTQTEAPVIKSAKKKVVEDNSEDEVEEEEFIAPPKKRKSSAPKKIEKSPRVEKIMYIKELREQILKRLSLAELEKLKHLDLLARVAIESQPAEFFENDLNSEINKIDNMGAPKVSVL